MNQSTRDLEFQSSSTTKMIHTFPYILRFRKAKKEKARSGEKKEESGCQQQQQQQTSIILVRQDANLQVTT